jgi:hypothetical protein
MEDCASFAFLRCWVLVTSYFCSRICIFNRLILEEYVSQVEGGPHLLQSCLHVVQDGFLLVVMEMHPSFENLTIINAPSL